MKSCTEIVCFSILFLTMLTGFNGTIHHEINVRAEIKSRTFHVKDDLTIHGPLNSVKNKIAFQLPALLKSVRVSLKSSKPEVLGLTISQQVSRNVYIKIPPNANWPKFLILSFEFDFKVSPPENPEKPTGYFLEDFLPRVAMEEQLTVPVSFRMTTDTPKPWKSVSQGERKISLIQDKRRITVWESLQPQQEIYLAIDRFTEYKKNNNGIKLYAFLRKNDPQLAERYLNVTGLYIDFYKKLLLPYPYKKFALVENAEPTGYGMPSFTLLGSRIIRFPFILHTSYPHEILHNWWGNGVYTNPNSGNWAEGLTTYLADHLMKELKGKGDRYRFQQLKKYLNYVGESKDFPLTEFQSRHDMVSQAIGYGKTLMMFHMLRRQLGNQTFLKALRKFYTDFQFRQAGLNDLRKTFETVSTLKLKPFFKQWTERIGAPKLEFSSAKVEFLKKEYHLRLIIHQQKPLFFFNLPVGVWSGENENFQLYPVPIRDLLTTVALKLTEEPRKVILDPYYDLFRKLDPEDVPPSVSQVYGASQVFALSVSEKPNDIKLASVLAMSRKNFSLLKNEADIPSNSALSIIGRKQRWIKKLQEQLGKYSVTISPSGITIEGKLYPWENHSFVFALRRPESTNHPLLWVVASKSESIPGLIRKLPHYGKFGYMVFEGNQPKNITSGIWPATSQRLVKTFRPGDYNLPRRKPLVDFEPDIP